MSRTAMVCGKLCTAPRGDYFVACSFDSNHVILRSRMPYHIIKCIKQHPGHNKIQCPYDSTEYIDPDKFPIHINTCESRKSLYSDKYQNAELKASGLMCDIKPTPFFHTSAPVIDEDWGQTKVNSWDEENSIANGADLIHVTNQDKDVIMLSSDEDDDFPLGCRRGVGRGISVKKSKPKRGMGRAELLSYVLKQYNKQQPSGSSESVTSSEKESSLRENITTGQFGDT